ncbi:hypothetical protein J2755_000831 [Methanohalophilus levihalophilus]|uniref:hypothetical protein n=1 Tax=Methanohalophilus levihalophilus TaxID=1431282 RepID=UPI001AE51BC0|nr:hypothetical protein [Methanohalophilus levihalophilus]MBP2029897.1 hypothetical protein [Methanohalophilus levihalophilus]
MNKYAKMALFGFILWVIPFFSGFPFVDSSGNFLIDEIFFKTIMILVGGFTGVILAVAYFKDIRTDYVKDGILLGVIWLVISLGLDLVMMSAGFFPMTVAEYFAEIGLRYLIMPMYTIGMGYALMQNSQ